MQLVQSVHADHSDGVLFDVAKIDFVDVPMLLAHKLTTVLVDLVRVDRIGDKLEILLGQAL